MFIFSSGLMNKFLQTIVSKIMTAPIIEYTVGTSPTPKKTHTGFRIASSIAMIMDSVAEIYLMPSLKII